MKECNRGTSMVRRSVTPAACLVAALFASGCSGEGAGPSDEVVAEAQAALSPGVDACVLGSSALRLGDRAVVQGLTGAGVLEVGVDGRVNGTTLVDGNGLLRDRARVTGDLTLEGTLTRGNGTVVTGTLRQNTPVTLPVLANMVVPAGDEVVNIGPGANVRLLNGGYGAVTIRARSRVLLSGTYDVTSWVVEPDVTLIEDPPGSGIQINSSGNVSFADRSVLTATDPTGVAIFAGLTSVSIGTNARITGIIAAPIARIRVGSRARVNGCVGGAELLLDPDASIVSTNPNATLPTQD
jgi:hypothetical protein